MCLNTSPAATQAASQAASVTVPGASRCGRRSPAWLSPLRVATHIVQLSAVTSQVWSPGRARPRTAAPGMPRTSVRVPGLTLLAGSLPAAASERSQRLPLTWRAGRDLDPDCAVIGRVEDRGSKSA